VGQRLAQEALRHSDPRLTAMVYTDASQLPMAAAIEKLPWLDGGKDSPIDSPRTDISRQPLSLPVIDDDRNRKSQVIENKTERHGLSRNVTDFQGGKDWYARQDSNLWPSAPEADALSS
jgi:hypothetical protein